MSRIKTLFKKKSGNILNMYCTAGYPELGSTMEVIRALHQHGADIIELGMPYSDPLADGPVIQQSSTVALANGMTMDILFKQLANLRQSPSVGGVGEDIPVILMGYMNPVLQYGFEKFCMHAAAVGIDGLILPDLPEFEFKNEYAPIIRQYGLDFIFLVTPETSDQRIRKLDSLSSGFLYAVSSSSTTGSDKNMAGVSDYLSRLQGFGLENPVLAGFGIKDRDSFNTVCKYTQGAIIGSAFIRQLAEKGDINELTAKFLNSIKN